MEALQKTIVIERSPDLERLIQEATWKDMLIELVRKNELDPWDIDISKLVEEYLLAIRQIKLLDLRVPANMMLAAAILVRLKSELLNINEEQQEEAEMQEQRPELYADSLLPRLRLPPKRKITLTELISALDEAIKIKEEREEKLYREQSKQPIVLSPIDVEQEAEGLLQVIKAYADKMRMMTFSNLVELLANKNPLLEVFIPLLFLVQSGKADLIQETFYGEIIIKLT